MNEKEEKIGKFLNLMILNNLINSTFFLSRKIQIIFDGFTVGRYNEGLDDNDFDSDRRLMTAAGGTEACK